LEKVVLENMRGIGKGFGRELLAPAERIAGGRREKATQTSRIDHANDLRLSLLVGHELTELTAAKRVKCYLVQSDAPAKCRVDKGIGLDARPVVEDALDADLDASALVHPRFVADDIEVLDRNRFGESKALAFEIDRISPRSLFGLC